MQVEGKEVSMFYKYIIGGPMLQCLPHQVFRKEAVGTPKEQWSGER